MDCWYCCHCGYSCRSFILYVRGKNCASELVGDSIKSDTAKVRPIEQKKDTLKKDTATSNVINKFVKPSQPKNEKRAKTNNPNEKTK